MLPVEYSADDFLSLTLLNFNPENLKRWVPIQNSRAVYNRENKPRITLAAAYIIRDRKYL